MRVPLSLSPHVLLADHSGNNDRIRVWAAFRKISHEVREKLHCRRNEQGKQELESKTTMLDPFWTIITLLSIFGGPKRSHEDSKKKSNI